MRIDLMDAVTKAVLKTIVGAGYAVLCGVVDDGRHVGVAPQGAGGQGQGSVQVVSS